MPDGTTNARTSTRDAPLYAPLVRPSTLLDVLLLRRAAILDAFHSRWSLAVGAILVLSAGLARNYDGEDLRAEPWWLAAPFGASLVTSFILWMLFALWARSWPNYLGFLGVYWLTAPLAWLYGIPYERFLTPEQAVEANAWTLLAVSLWRVVIIARTFQVLYGIHLVRTLIFTLAFGAVTMFIATLLTPRPVLDIMGGMRQLPEDRAASGLAFVTGFFSLIASVVFGIAALVATPAKPTEPRTAAAPAAAPTPGKPTALLLIAALAVVAWIPPLLTNQPLQRNRRTAERAFQRADYAGLLAELSRRQPSDYPPSWRLPGWHLAAYFRADHLADLLFHINASTPAWVRDGYLEMARDSVLRHAPYTDAKDWAKWAIEEPQMFERDGYHPTQQLLRWLIDNDPTLTDEKREKLRQIKLPAPPPSPQPPDGYPAQHP